MTDYNQLFSIRLEHDFYKDLSFTDLEVQPTKGTEKLLAGQRLTLKKNANGLAVIAPFADAKPDLDAEESFVLAFTVSIKRPNFIQFTDFSLLGGAEPYRIVNTAGHNRLDIGEGASAFAQAGAFATIEIHSDALLAEAHWRPFDYYFRFSSLKAPWRYYLVTNDEGNSFSLEHDPEEADGGAAIEFTKALLDPIADQDKVLQSLVSQYPGKQYYRFVSKEPIAYRRQGVSGIHLKRAETVWMQNLPNPRFVDNGTHVIDLIQQGKSGGQSEFSEQFPSGGLQFDGQDDYVWVPLKEPETNLTHELWFKTASDDVGLLSFFIGIPGNRGRSDRQLYTYDGKVRGEIYRKSYAQSGSLKLDDGQWHHVAYVLSQDGSILYVDGRRLGEQKRHTKIGRNDAGDIVVGYAESARHDFFKGAITEVRLWEKARTQTEIIETASKRLTGKEEGLLLYWPLNEGFGRVAEDASDNGKNGTIVGASW